MNGDTFLTPVEKPKGFVMKLVYRFFADNSGKYRRR